MILLRQVEAYAFNNSVVLATSRANAEQLASQKGGNMPLRIVDNEVLVDDESGLALYRESCLQENSPDRAFLPGLGAYKVEYTYIGGGRSLCVVGLDLLAANGTASEFLSLTQGDVELEKFLRTTALSRTLCLTLDVMAKVRDSYTEADFL